MKTHIVISIFIIVILTGCATTPTKEQLASIGYGNPLTIDYQKAIKDYFEISLFDPFSAQYKFETPGEYWAKEPPLLGSRLYAGYGVPVSVNAKNRYGAYVGYQKYIFIFRDDKIIKVITPSELRLMKR